MACIALSAEENELLRAEIERLRSEDTKTRHALKGWVFVCPDGGDEPTHERVSAVVAEVEKQQLVTVDEDGRYTITRRGTTVADTLAYDLPRTVRESAIRAVMQIRSWRHRAASNRAVVQEKDGQFSVVCSIADMGSDVFRMELAMPDKLTEFTLESWHGLMDYGTVYAADDIRFTFRNGQEIRA